MESQWRKERNRTWLILVFVLLWAALAASLAPRPSWGADEEKKPAAAADETGPGGWPPRPKLRRGRLGGRPSKRHTDLAVAVAPPANDRAVRLHSATV